MLHLYLVLVVVDDVAGVAATTAAETTAGAAGTTAARPAGEVDDTPMDTPKDT